MLIKPLCLSFLSLTLIIACQSSPNTTPTHSEMPFPNITPRPGSASNYINSQDKTEADVQSKQEFASLNSTRFNPAQTKVIYTYSQQRKVIFKDYNVAEKSVNSGLWYYHREQQKHTQLLPASQDYSGIRLGEVSWLNNTEIVYLDAERRNLLSLNVETQETKVLFNKAFMLSFKVQEGKVFILTVEDNKPSITRIDSETNAQQVREIPYADFYMNYDFDVLTADLILLGQFKDYNKNNTYPFKVATTSPPPRQDSFLFDLKENQLTPLEQGLDLESYEKIEMSPDQEHFATQRGVNTQLYNRSGKLILEQKGTFYWLNAKQLILQQDREIFQATIQEEEVKISERLTTQTPCSKAQGTEPTLMECSIGNHNNSYSTREPVNRVFRLFPLQELKTDPSEANDSLNRRLAPAEKGQPIRIWEENATEHPNYTRLQELSSTGELQTVFELKSSAAPSFTFDPNDYWYQIY